MTREERDILPIRRLWAAVCDRAISDYRKAILYGDELEENKTRKEMEVMGCPPSQLDRLKENALIFKHFVDEHAHLAVKHRPLCMECPACHNADKLILTRGRVNVCASCHACGMRYIHHISIK